MKGFIRLYLVFAIAACFTGKLCIATEIEPVSLEIEHKIESSKAMATGIPVKNDEQALNYCKSHLSSLVIIWPQAENKDEQINKIFVEETNIWDTKSNSLKSTLPYYQTEIYLNPKTAEQLLKLINYRESRQSRAAVQKMLSSYFPSIETYKKPVRIFFVDESSTSRPIYTINQRNIEKAIKKLFGNSEYVCNVVLDESCKIAELLLDTIKPQQNISDEQLQELWNQYQKTAQKL